MTSDLCVASNEVGADALSAFRTLADRVRERVEVELASTFRSHRSSREGLGPEVRAMLAAVDGLTMRGGKRLRAALAMVGYLSVGGVETEAAPIAVGAALELLQSYFLIHDDWMDGDLLRRGGKSVHAAMVDHFGSDHLGASAGILAGDYANAMALEMICMASADRSTQEALVRQFANIQQDAVLGQLLDVSSKEENVEQMHALKTGSYTVKGPLLLGAILGRGSEAAKSSLELFSAPLGVAFQLRDDLLGTFGESSETGKPFGNDLRTGKRTAVVVAAQERGADFESNDLKTVFGSMAATDDEVRHACQVLERLGVVEQVEKRIEDLRGSAVKVLSTAPFSEQGKWLLEGAAIALTRRKS